MTDSEQTVQGGDTLFEAFVEQVKQVLEHLYDFAYLQQHPLARRYDSDGDLSAKTAGRQLRLELIKAVESLKPPQDAHFRAPIARLYNILHFYYVENMNIQIAAAELGLSERQAYRDLRRGQERIASVLWNNRLPATTSEQDFSLESEVARLKLNLSTVDVGAVFQQAERSVEKLAQQRQVTITVEAEDQPMRLSTDAALAHQIMVSLLSHAIQQANQAALHASFATEHATVTLTLRYVLDTEGDTGVAFAAVTKLMQRLGWELTSDVSPEGECRIVLQMTSERTTILVVDDNDGWVELLARFLEGYNCLVVSASASQDAVAQAAKLKPDLVILDVMMPERDGWELLQRLRVQPATASTPILVCTVFDDPQLALSLGASAFVSKPASREQILEALKQIIVI